MRLYLQAVLLGLTLSSLQHGVSSRAFPEVKTSSIKCIDDSCRDSSNKNLLRFRTVEDPINALDRRALDVRFDFDPPVVVPKPEPVPEPPSEGPLDPSDPLDPLIPEDPTEPQTPTETDPSGPIEFGTFASVKPTVVATKSVPTASVTDKAPTATPKTSDKPATPKATAAASSNDGEITSSSPGGLSGDNSNDVGGFGDGPDDVNCPLGTRGLFGLQRRCSRLNRPLDWTAFDDIIANKSDTAQDALKKAIEKKLPDKVGVNFNTAYVDPKSSTKDTFNEFYSKQLPKSAVKDDFFDSIAGTIFQKTQLRSKAPPGRSNKNPVFNELAMSEDGKVMIASYSHAEEDTSKTLRWSEIAFQRRQVYPGSNIKALASILRISVDNRGTLNTLKQAYSDLGKKFGESGDKVILHANAAAGSAEKVAFEAMLRTDNVRGVNWLLGDHHQAIGDKHITTLTIWPDNSNCAILISIG